jgi:GntR family transcriptional regulator / MocR family aminotransferase
MNRTTSPEVLVRIQRRRGVPLRAQLEGELRAAIRAGRLRPGAQLPSTRALAADLGLSRGRVVEAYEQLLAEGYVTARPGSGTRVAACESERAATLSVSVEPAPPTMRYDFRPGVPDASMFPRRAWLTSLRRVLTSASGAALGYPDPRGVEQVRAALAAYLNRARGTAARADRVVMCAGFTQGLRLMCRALQRRGVASMAIEDPCHAPHRAAILSTGLKVIPIPVDEGGLRVERLRSSDAGAVFVTPAHQFPTGAVLAPERRAAVLDWSTRTGALVIEDDYDAEYRYDREPVGAIQGLAPDRIAYAGSVSKTLAPALRVGWLVLPAELTAEVARLKYEEDLGSPALDQLAYADFLTRGELDRHLRRTRRHYRRRRDVLIASLHRHVPTLRIQGVAAGLHLMVELDPTANEKEVVAAAAKLSVRVYGVRAHRAHNPGPPALLLGYGNLSHAAIAEGVRRLAAVLA